MFELFTPKARAVIVDAQDEARKAGAAAVGVEHLLLGLLRERENLPTLILEQHGITYRRVQDQLLGADSSVPAASDARTLPFTSAAREVLNGALVESMRFSHHYIGPEHLALSLLRRDAVVLPPILAAAGTDSGSLGREILRMLAGGAVRERRRPLHWELASWVVEGQELRIPLTLSEAECAAFVADSAWTDLPLSWLKMAVADGRLQLKSVSAAPAGFLAQDPLELHAALDGVIERALEAGRSDSERAQLFLQLLRHGANGTQPENRSAG